MLDLPESYHRWVWGLQEYYRVFSLVNGGRRAEDDLFEGVRDRASRLVGRPDLERVA